jgi:hypothetical protein
MISKSNRFSNTKYLDDLEAPGPGSYTPLVAGSGILPVAKGAKPQSMFAKPRHYRDEIVPVKEMVPGPGTYNLQGGYKNGKTIQEITEERTGSSFFLDGINRLKTTEPQTEQVAPGTYNVGAADDALYNFGKKDRKTGRHMPDASMTSKSQRGLQFKSGAPGPGDYAVDKADKILMKGAGNESRMMASFASNAKGRQEGKAGDAAPTPGPGWYDLGSAGNISSSGGESAFRSGSERIGGSGIRQVKPPGPAYYHTKTLPTKKTFHWNVDNKWV